MTHATKCKTRDINFAGGNIIPRKCDCDGYHTFDELYDHRVTLFIALCKKINAEDEQQKQLQAFKEGFAFDRNSWIRRVWRSTRHSDGDLCFGTGTQFVFGIDKLPSEQITYHIPIERWDETDFAETLEKAPDWDGHTSEDVLNRLKDL